MGLEDISLFRSINGSTVFYPSDAVSCERAVELAANTQGVCFIRTSRPAMKTIYEQNEVFAVGGAKVFVIYLFIYIFKLQVLRQSPTDQCVVIGAGVTLIEALDAGEQLATQDSINVCIIDPFTIKPLDVHTIRKHVARCGGRVLTVEDHYREGMCVCSKLAWAFVAKADSTYTFTLFIVF
jgi:transketolase